MSIRHRVQSQVRSYWTELPNYHDNNTRRFAKGAAAIVGAGQQRTASLTAAFIDVVVAQDTGRFAATRIDPAKFVGIRGVPPVDQYMRPAQQLWWGLSQGDPLATAVSAGLGRAMVMAATDMQMAKTYSAQETMSTIDSVGSYERVVDGSACDLCDSMSSETYSSNDIMPIHPNCSCDVLPVIGSAPTGQPQSDPTVDVVQHDELGPVLVPKPDTGGTT